MTQPIAHFNLQRESYPFTLEFFSIHDPTGTHLLEEIRVEGPGRLFIPPVARREGVPVWIRISYPDGTVQEQWPT